MHCLYIIQSLKLGYLTNNNILLINVELFVSVFPVVI